MDLCPYLFTTVKPTACGTFSSPCSLKRASENADPKKQAHRSLSLSSTRLVYSGLRSL